MNIKKPIKKISKQGFLAFLTFIALIILLAVQVNWLFNAAKLEEDHFNRTVSKALIEAREEIGECASTCNDMNNYLCGRPCQANVQKTKISEIDEIIKSKLEIYNIDLEYTFEITDSTFNKKNKKLWGEKCYLQSLNGLLKEGGIKIRLQFPNRNQFLMAQIRGAFLLAVFSVIFVLISFIITSRLFRKERQMVTKTSDFINNMVHEFQTPLSNIRLASSLIKKRENAIADDKINEYISVIIKENHKLEKNVEEILKVSCTGSDACSFEDIDLHELISKTSDEFVTRIESLDGSLDKKLNAEHPVLKASPEHFRLIVSNLIDNAIKYSKGAPQIEITSKTVGKNIRLRFKDKGIGIDKKDQSAIFEKYFRVSTGDIHNVKGFGLGLTYVKKLVEQYRGKISVSSSKDNGTVFTIILPLKNGKN